jgi:hypothetical protein
MRPVRGLVVDDAEKLSENPAEGVEVGCVLCPPDDRRP